LQPDEGNKVMTEDERAIRDVIDLWMSASKKGDVATLLDLMTEDVIFMVPGREPFGQSAFREAAEANKRMQIENETRRSGPSLRVPCDVSGRCPSPRRWRRWPRVARSDEVWAASATAQAYCPEGFLPKREHPVRRNADPRLVGTVTRE
jgi:hypothetical protein